MERDGELNQYRETLAHQLKGHERLRAEADCDIFRIFVNHRCLGTMDHAGGRATFVSSFEGEEVALLEVRTDSGLLMGSVSGIGTHERTVRIRVGGQHALVLALKNYGDRGIVKVTYQPTETNWLRWPRLVVAPLGWTKHAWRACSELPWAMRASLAIQVGLVAGFVYLLLLAGDGGLRKESLTQHIQALARNQQALIEKLAAYEKSSAESKVEIERRVEQRLLAKQKKTAREVAQVRKQIKSLAAAKEALKQDVAVAYGLNRELRETLKQQAEILARMKSKPSSEGPQSSYRATSLPPLAQAEEPPKVAEGSRSEELQPLTFWVAFHEGTTEANVQDLLLQIHGRKIEGPAPTGWINVEAQLKPSETIEGFFETVRKSNIVSAIRTSVTGR